MVLQFVLARLGAVRSTTKARSRLPNSSSSTPIAAASTTALVATRQSSTSWGKTFSPPETIISSSRPSTNSRPSSSKRPTSPVDIRPSIDVLAAAAGVALEQQAVADEDPAGLALRQLAGPRRRGSARRCPRRLAGRVSAPRAGPPGWRSWRRRPRSSRRCCRGCRRSWSIQVDAPGRRAAPSPTAATTDATRGRTRERLLGQLQDPLQHHRDHDQRVALRSPG